MNILLPVDGPDDAKLILSFVLKYQWPKGVEFKILHVVGSSKADAEAKRSEEKARLLVERVAKKLKSMIKSAVITVEVRFGAAIYEIVDAAASCNSQMIVMGYRTRSQTKPFLIGSVANSVANVAPCSVAIIRPDRGSTDGKMDVLDENSADPQVRPRRKTTRVPKTTHSRSYTRPRRMA